MSNLVHPTDSQSFENLWMAVSGTFDMYKWMAIRLPAGRHVDRMKLKDLGNL